MSVVEIVKEQNPWWSYSDAIEADDDIKNFKESKFPWIPKFVEQIDFEPAVHSIRGPRRIGKTTLLKYLIRTLIRRGIPPNKILYVSCDGLSDWTELRDVLRIYSDKGVSYFFIDEASFIPEWSRAVKYVYDVGKIKHSFVLITGSHAMDIIRGVERLPGRRGIEKPGKDFVLLPATFADYVRVVDPKLLEEIIRGENPLLSMGERRSRIFSLFEKYLYAGGFPKAQHQSLSKGYVSQESFEEYLTYLKGDALRERLDVNVLLATVRRIIEILTVPVSWRSLANGTGYHHEKIREHVEFLRFSFALEYIYPPKQVTGGIIPDVRRNRKIYFLDPFIMYAFYSWAFGTRGHQRIAERWLGIPELRGKLLEAVILRHIIEWTSGPLFSEEIRRDVFYVKTSKRELDFLAVKGNLALAVEVKRRARMGYHFAVADSLIRGKRIVKVLATMGDLRVEKGFLEVPIPYLLLLLSEDLIYALEYEEAKSGSDSDERGKAHHSFIAYVLLQ